MTRLVVVTSLNRMVQTLGADMPNATVHHRFGEFARQAGAVPVFADHHADPVALAERVDGVVINGGGDVAPERYGAARREETRDVEPERDEFEIELVLAAADRGIPVLGICRGVQLVNVALGGTLIQDVPDHMHRAAWSGDVHDVELEPGSRLHGLYGRDRLRVNSLHHQAIDRVAPGLRSSAHAPDATVEAIEDPDRPILGVQWHPEFLARPAGDVHAALFRWLCGA